MRKRGAAMITEVLATGAQNARTGREICKVLNLSSRELTQAVEIERRKGSPICASVSKPYGYYLAANQQEMQAYCRSLHHRAGEIFKTRSVCLEMIDSLPAAEGQ
jgi:hypothetical protein